MVLEFCGSGGSEGDPSDHQHVEEEHEDPFEFLVELVDAVDPPFFLALAI